jgi:N-acetyl-anhydromuramyl-L-alanine amidase AmpD
MIERFKKSPNISKNKILPMGIVLHHTAGSYVGSVEWCMTPKSKVSYHCIVDLNGERTILANDTNRTWHAGKSTFKGKKDCNSFMLGIAVSGDTNNRRLTQFEIDSVAQWCVNKIKLYKFGIDMITTHREISPGRKTDVSVDAENQIIDKIKTLIT